MDHESIIAKGLVERIGIEGGKLTHKYGDKTYTVTPDAIKDHTEAMNLVLEALLSKEHGVISSISEIGAVAIACSTAARSSPPPASLIRRAWTPSRRTSPSGLCTIPPTSWAFAPARP